LSGGRKRKKRELLPLRVVLSRLLDRDEKEGGPLEREADYLPRTAGKSSGGQPQPLSPSEGNEKEEKGPRQDIRVQRRGKKIGAEDRAGPVRNITFYESREIKKGRVLRRGKRKGRHHLRKKGALRAARGRRVNKVLSIELILEEKGEEGGRRRGKKPVLAVKRKKSWRRQKGRRQCWGRGRGHAR